MKFLALLVVTVMLFASFAAAADFVLLQGDFKGDFMSFNAMVTFVNEQQQQCKISLDITDSVNYGVYSNPPLTITPDMTTGKATIAFTDQSMTSVQMAIYFDKTDTCTDASVKSILASLPGFLPTVKVETVIVTTVSQKKNAVGTTCTKHSECVTTNCVATDKKDEVDETTIYECSDVAKFGQKDEEKKDDKNAATTFFSAFAMMAITFIATCYAM